MEGLPPGGQGVGVCTQGEGGFCIGEGICLGGGSASRERGICIQGEGVCIQAGGFGRPTPRN